MALPQISADIMLNRMRSVARSEKNRRAKHPPGITFVSFEHHIVSKKAQVSYWPRANSKLSRTVGSRPRAGNMASDSATGSRSIDLTEDAIKHLELFYPPHADARIGVVAVITTADPDIAGRHLRLKRIGVAIDIGIHEVRL